MYPFYFDIAKVLFDKGYDINIKSNGRCTGFYIACQNGKIGIVKLLIENNAVINKIDN